MPVQEVPVQSEPVDAERSRHADAGVEDPAQRDASLPAGHEGSRGGTKQVREHEAAHGEEPLMQFLVAARYEPLIGMIFSPWEGTVRRLLDGLTCGDFNPDSEYRTHRRSLHPPLLPTELGHRIAALRAGSAH